MRESRSAAAGSFPVCAADRPGRGELGRRSSVQWNSQLDVNRQPVHPGPSDAALVRQAQDGVAEAFAELVSRYQDRLYNTCYRLCNDDAEALDLTQTTFLKALEALPRFEARANFYTWLFRIAVNQAFSQRRARRYRRTASLDELDERGHWREPAAPAEQHNPSRSVEREEARQQVQAALARLDPEFRAAVVLKDIESMDYASIAEILEVPVGTVKSRIYRGRMMLRELLVEGRTEVGRKPA